MFVAGLFVGSFVGVLVMCLMQVNEDKQKRPDPYDVWK